MGGTNRGGRRASDFVNVHFLVDCRSQKTFAKSQNVNEALHKKRAGLLRRDSETIYLLMTNPSMT